MVETYLARKARDSSTTYASVALEFGVGEASLNRWMRRMREEGTVEPRAARLPEVRRKLTPEQADTVAAWVLAHPTKRLWEIGEYILREYCLTVSEGTIRRRLGERGIGKRRLQKVAAGSREEPGKADDWRYEARHRRKPEDKPHRRSYPSDFTDAEWAAVEPLWREHARALPEKYELRDVVEALRYIGATGCPWRYLPNDFPPHQTVRHWFDRWQRDGTIGRVNEALRRLLRRNAAREETPSILIIDSLSIKSNEGGEERGYDGGKKVAGRKRHIAVDTLGLPWLIKVHSAGLQDRDGIALVVPVDAKKHLPRLEKIIADAGYQGRGERTTLERTGIPVEIVRRRGDTTTGEWGEKAEPSPTYTPEFRVLPKRWIVERSLAWCTRRRRLARDYERTVRASEGWVEMAFQHTMTARMVG